MKLTVDNLLGLGPQDYTFALDWTIAPRVERKINQPGVMRCSLVANSPGFVAPPTGARVVLARADQGLIFTGYLTQAPQAEYLGWGEQGPVYRYNLVAASDEVVLDEKALPERAPFVFRTAGSALRQMAEDLLPGWFDTSAVQDVDILTAYLGNSQQKFSYHAGEIASAARAAYRAMDGKLMLNPVGAASYAIREDDEHFSAAGLSLNCPNRLVNDVTVIGLDEPQDYVRDYFVGDGLSQRFYLSQKPFLQSGRVLIDEEYLSVELDDSTWTVTDPGAAISVVARSLQVQGGTGQDGGTTVAFVEQVELGGALKLQHGDITICGPARGVLGGLYGGAISAAECLAGFQVSPNGSRSGIQALINGSAAGPVVTTTEGHRYVLTTYVYSLDVYRSQETYHSSAHPAGRGRGGSLVPGKARFVLEVQDIDPASPATVIAPATVLFDDVVTDAPGFCRYALVNAASMQCNIAFTYASRISTAEVRMALPNQKYATRLVGSLSDGGQCVIASSTTLDFYPQYVPPLNALLVASYRGSGRAVAEVVSSEGVAGLARGADDGVRGTVRTMERPSPRTQADCENAALAVLDDAVRAAWSGSYQTWSDFLPGNAGDIFPGDAVEVNVPSHNADFSAIVRKVTIDLLDPANDRGKYMIEFANDLAEPLAYRDVAGRTGIALQSKPTRIAIEQVGVYYLANLTAAQITQVTSTTVAIDAGIPLPSGCGIEVRAHDFGWGVANDRNLLGRFNTATITVPRLGRTQNYFLRLYDRSSPPRYSRYSAALHLDYPL